MVSKSFTFRKAPSKSGSSFLYTKALTDWQSVAKQAKATDGVSEMHSRFDFRHAPTISKPANYSFFKASRNSAKAIYQTGKFN